MLGVSRREHRTNKSILEELDVERELMAKVVKLKLQYFGHCDVYVGGKVRVSEFMIFLDLQHCGSK